MSELEPSKMHPQKTIIVLSLIQKSKMQAKMFKAVGSRLFFRARCSSSSLCVEVQTMYKSKSVPIKNTKQPNNNIEVSAVIGEAMKATALSKNCICFLNTILLRLDIFGNDCRNEEEDESSLFLTFHILPYLAKRPYTYATMIFTLKDFITRFLKTKSDVK